jgi:hypothetical protein
MTGYLRVTIDSPHFFVKINFALFLSFLFADASSTTGVNTLPFPIFSLTFQIVYAVIVAEKG